MYLLCIVEYYVIHYAMAYQCMYYVLLITMYFYTFLNLNNDYSSNQDVSAQLPWSHTSFVDCCRTREEIYL